MCYWLFFVCILSGEAQSPEVKENLYNGTDQKVPVGSGY